MIPQTERERERDLHIICQYGEAGGDSGLQEKDTWMCVCVVVVGGGRERIIIIINYETTLETRSLE